MTEGVWLSITEYSRYKNVSVSTIRRHIKQNILRHREEQGKYLIYVPNAEKLQMKTESEELRIKLELELLRTQLREAREENSELKMLVDLYENQNQNKLPELPVHS